MGSCGHGVLRRPLHGVPMRSGIRSYAFQELGLFLDLGWDGACAEVYMRSYAFRADPHTCSCLIGLQSIRSRAFWSNTCSVIANCVTSLYAPMRSKKVPTRSANVFFLIECVFVIRSYGSQVVPMHSDHKGSHSDK